MAPPPPSTGGDAVIDFTLVKQSVKGGDGTYEAQGFRQGSTFIRIALPQKWTPYGSTGEFYLINIALPGARITLRKSALPPPVLIDIAWLNSTKGLILQSLKSDGPKQIVSATEKPLDANGWMTAEIRAAYNSGGLRQASSYIFIKQLEGSFLELVINCRDEDFNTVRRTAVDLLYSWTSISSAQQNRPARPKPTPAVLPVGR